MGELFVLYGETIAVDLRTQKDRQEGQQGQEYVDKSCITLRSRKKKRRKTRKRRWGGQSRRRRM